MYGYEPSQMVKEQTNVKIHLKDGSLYPALHKRETLLDEMRDFIRTIEKVVFNNINPTPAG
jgi:hypothetical protein